MQNPNKFLGNELQYIKKVLNAESWASTGGSWTGKLEQSFAEKFESKYAIAFNSGTSTMHAALLALGVKPGDEVISPALSVIMNTSTTIHAHAIPVYADIDPLTFTIDPDDIERKITNKTKAIMVVSVYGLSADMDRIMDISRKYNLPVIEDNAECFLGYYKNKLVGTFGEVSSYSFEDSKHISCGEGGILTTDNEHVAEICRKVGNHGFKNLSAKEGRVKLDLDVFQSPNFKRHDLIGWNYRLSEFSSAIALAQLERIDELVDMRIETAKIFMDRMEGVDYLTPQMSKYDAKNSFWALAVKYDGHDKRGLSWEDFRKRYIELGGDGFYGAWSVPYLEPVISNRKFVDINPDLYQSINYVKGLCPVAEDIQQKLMIFKTNYRDLDLAKNKADILQKLINEIG